MFTDRFRARAANVVFRRAIPNFCECFLLVCFCPARLLDTQKRALEINPYVPNGPVCRVSSRSFEHHTYISIWANLRYIALGILPISR